MLLTIDQIEQADDLPCSLVSAWGGEVKLVSLPANEYIEWETAKTDDSSSLDKIVKLLQLSCVKEDGSKLFSKESVKVLHKKSPKTILKLFNEAVKLNSLQDNEIESKVKNS